MQLLEALLSAPAPQPLLLVCDHRSELAASSDALAAFRDARERLSGVCDFRDVEVAELTHAEARELASGLLEHNDAPAAEAVAVEARGNPLFVAELARWANERRGWAVGDGGGVLEQVILARVADLSEDARALLETISLARGPNRARDRREGRGAAGRQAHGGNRTPRREVRVDSRPARR